MFFYFKREDTFTNLSISLSIYLLTEDARLQQVATSDRVRTAAARDSLSYRMRLSSNTFLDGGEETRKQRYGSARKRNRPAENAGVTSSSFVKRQ